MKIWVIGRSYPMPSNNLRGSFELEQALLLSKKGHDVSYLACVFHHKNRVKNWGHAAWREQGIGIYCHSQPFTPERLGLYCPALWRRCWRELFEKAESESSLPDIIHVHYPAMLCEPEVLDEYRRRGVRVVSTEHWSRVLLKKLKSHELARSKWHMTFSDGVAAVSKPLASALAELTGSDRDTMMIPNMINPVFKPSPKKELNIFRFVTVGRLVPLRQYDKVILAFDSLFHGRADVTLTLIGNGGEYKKLRALIKKLHAEGNIFLRGIMSREECASSLADADCLICYSRYETFGVPVIEAWACGIPVIVSRQLGFLDGTGGEKLGIAADPDDLESLRSAMTKITETIEDFDPEYISRHAEANYSESAVYKKLRELYLLNEE